MTREFVPHEGAIQAKDIAPGAPLKQSEISRFILAADGEGFQKTDHGLHKPEGQFKPKSLFDLAQEAAERAPVMVEPEPPEPVSPEPPRQAEAPEAAPEGPDVAAPAVSPQELDTAPGSPLPEPDAALADEHPEAGRAEQRADEIPTPAKELAQSSPSPLNLSADDLEAEKAKAFADGVEAGQNQVRDQVEAMMSHAIGLLEQTMAAFSDQAETALDDLSVTIEQSVLSLASSRAGMQIETMPRAFAARIEQLADRIRTSTQSPIVRLHPSDVVVITPVFEQSSALLNLRLVADASLQRGDVKLSLEGVKLTDVLPRVEAERTFVEYVPLTLAEDALHPAPVAEEMARAHGAQTADGAAPDGTNPAAPTDGEGAAE